MTSFFEHQTQARARTKILIFLYLVAVALIILAIYAVAISLQGQGIRVAMPGLAIPNPAKSFWDPALFGVVSCGVLGIIGVASLFKIWQLGGSGANVATMLGGELLHPSSNHPDHKKILNVVEEVAIACGMKVPPVYIMNQEESINAFAAGTNPGNAVIGVSKGCIELLNRDQLQGVIAHEFSHILNGDMALNLRLIGILYGILFIALTGRFMTEATMRGSRYRSSRDSKGSGGGLILAVGLSLLVIGYTGVFFANLIKMAVSRQREYLADASAVQFTRNPDGLAGALKKIGQFAYGSRINNSHAEEASHLFFADGLSKKISGLFSTHPPLVERIRRLQPGFDGKFDIPESSTYSAEATSESKKPKPTAGTKIAKSGQNIVDQIINSVGTLGVANLTQAHEVIEQLPQRIKEAVHDPYAATLVIYQLLMDSDPAINKKQLDILQEQLPSGMFQEFLTLQQRNPITSQESYLTILDLSLPTLSQLSDVQFRFLRNTCTELAHADQKINLPEYLLHLILMRHYDQKFNPQRLNKNFHQPTSALVQPASDLFLSLSFFGNPDNLEKAKEAYQAAANHCAIPERFWPDFNQIGSLDLDIMGNALQELSTANYQIREVILRACISCITKDQHVTNHEMLLIRAIASIFDCPIPL